MTDKYCKHCAEGFVRWGQRPVGEHVCRSLRVPTEYGKPDMVEGMPDPTYPHGITCKQMRENDDLCGKEAKWFRDISEHPMFARPASHVVYLDEPEPSLWQRFRNLWQ